MGFLLNFKFLYSAVISPNLGHICGPLPMTFWFLLVLKFVSGQESSQPVACTYNQPFINTQGPTERHSSSS